MTEKQIDLDFARARRNDGMARAEDHAESDSPGWKEEAYLFLLAFSAAGAEFTTEQMVEASTGKVPPPPDKRAWGGIVNRARKRKVLVRRGYTTDKYCSPKPIWSRACG